MLLAVPVSRQPVFVARMLWGVSFFCPVLLFLIFADFVVCFLLFSVPPFLHRLHDPQKLSAGKIEVDRKLGEAVSGLVLPLFFTEVGLSALVLFAARSSWLWVEPVCFFFLSS